MEGTGHGAYVVLGKVNQGFSQTITSHRRQCHGRHKFFHLFELMLYVPVNSYGYVGTLPPFYRTFTQNEGVMTYSKLLQMFVCLC